MKKIIIILAIILIAVGIFFYFQNKKIDAIQTVNNEKIKEKKIMSDNVKNQNIKEVDTSNWLVYKNDNYGYEIKYPKGVEIFESNDIETDFNLEKYLDIFIDRKIDAFSNKFSGFFSILIYKNENPDLLTGCKWFDVLGPQNQPKSPYPDVQKEITLNNLSACYIEYWGGQSFGYGLYIPVFYYIAKGSNIYEISGLKIPEPTPKEILNDLNFLAIKKYEFIFNIMVKTFKFKNS